MKQHTLIARELLAGAPEYWRFTPVGDAKVPVDPKSGKAATGWQNNPYSLDQICSMNGVVKAVGLMTGVVSQTMAIDFDGPGSDRTFEKGTGHKVSDLPNSISWTSQREGRHQVALRVPMGFWQRLSNKKVLKPEGGGTEGQVELRWNGHQSVVVGHHPKTDGYVFLKGRSPSEQELAIAPEWLLELMLAPVIKQDETPTSSPTPFTDAERTRQFLKKEFVPAEQFSDYETWLAVGMAVHDVSRETGKSDRLLPDWISWCEGMSNFDESECLREWGNWTAKGVTEPRLTFRSLVDRVKKLGGDILHDADWHPIRDARPGGFLERGRQYVLRNAEQLKAACAEWNRCIREAPQTEEEKEAAKESKAVAAIDERMENLYQLERSGDCSKQAWAHKQYHRSVLGGYRVRCEEVDRRLIEMVATEWGLRIQSENTVAKRGRSMLAGTQEHDRLIPQIPGFTLLGRDALLVGSGGVGKTLAAMGISYQTATGKQSVFDRDDEIKPEALGATLWIGTDGGDGAYSMLNKYISILKAPQERTWRSKFNFWGSNRATGETPWAFNVSNLHKLFQELEQGFNGEPYRLVVIDSLKAVMDLGGIDFGIGPMGTCMRLIQAAADRFNVTVLWLHHTKPGAAKADMGIDGAGGNSNITQVPFAVHTLHKVQRKGHEHVVRWSVHKLRGEGSRAFEYTLDDDNGLFKRVYGDVEEDRTSDILLQAWLKRDAGVSTTEILESVDVSKKTVQKRLTEMGKDDLIKSLKKRWWITPKGVESLSFAMPELPDINEWLESKGGG